MKIVIAGAGEVGTHLAKMLSRENHDIILIDEDDNKLRPMEENYDIMVAEGLSTSIYDLKEAGIENCDLFIAVTPIESQNITSCILAHKLGAKKTLARINNYEYLQEENQQFFRDLGIDALIYPELLAAKEIVNSLKINWIRQWMEFSNGALTLIGMKVRNNASIINQKLMDLRNSQFYRVVAIRRDTVTIIPKGSDSIKANDIVYFITTKDYVTDVREQAGKEVIQVKEENANNIPKLLEQDNVMAFNGDASDLDFLKEEGIEEMDAFVALSDNSEANILACITAKRMGLKKTIAEIENIDYIPLAESLDIGTVINKKLTAASYIYQYTLDADVHNVKCLTHVDADVVELTPKQGAPITSGKIKDITIPKDIFIGGYIRDGIGHIANGDSEIMPGDDVIVFCVSSSFHKLDKLFN